MDNKINLFYLGSNSHIIIADGIIKAKSLPLESVYFVTYRGVKLPPQYENRLLFDESKILNRKSFFLKNYFKLNKIVKGKEICGYFPFQEEFPVMKFFSEYVFFEEGLSAYDTSLDYKFHKDAFLKSFFKQYLYLRFLNRNMMGLYNGRRNGSPFPFECTLMGLTNKSYSNVIMDNCRKETIGILGEPLKRSLIKDSFIIIMDSTHAIDRMDNADNYLQIMSDVLKSYDLSSKNVLLKLHPDNYKDMEDAIALIKKHIGFVDFKVIDESLEDVALSNQNNIFFGNHSTILFYAPIFGKTNKSISFARINAERDETYVNFLRRWGGVEGCLNLFRQQIECL